MPIIPEVGVFVGGVEGVVKVSDGCGAASVGQKNDLKVGLEPLAPHFSDHVAQRVELGIVGDGVAIIHDEDINPGMR